MVESDPELTASSSRQQMDEITAAYHQLWRRHEADTNLAASSLHSPESVLLSNYTYLALTLKSVYHNIGAKIGNNRVNFEYFFFYGSVLADVEIGV